ncbi:MAG: precorrin-6A reductase [Desulfitobacteriaceae bacterium]
MILLIGETAAAREIHAGLSGLGIETIQVETKERTANFIGRGRVLLEQKSVSSLVDWLLDKPCTAVLDASHPSCSPLFSPLRQQCDKTDIPYLRLERPETKVPVSPLIQVVQNWDQAMQELEEQVQMKRAAGRNPVTVFITTGSHQLENLVQSPLAKFTRLVVRVLPEGRLVQKCQDLGIPPRDIVAMQGPFSKELNRILFKIYGTDILLTRDSGPAGGTDTKISAALVLGLQVILLKRPTQSAGLIAHTVKEVLAWVTKHGGE